MKKLIIGLSILVLGFVSGKSVYAGNNLITECDDSPLGCTLNSNNPLFDESNLYPGYSVTQTIQFINTSDKNGTVGVSISELEEDSERPNQEIFQDISNLLISQAFALSSLYDQIFIIIRRGSDSGPIIYGSPTKSLFDWQSEGEIILDTLAPGTSQTYFFTATLNDQLENDYMGRSMIFNTNVGSNFSSIPTTPSNPGGGGGGGGGEPFVCHDTPPTGTPFVSVISRDANSVTLSFGGATGTSHYALNFGVQPNNPIYGNPNIGNGPTYTVTGLDPNTNYFFQVIPINGCAPGNRSAEIATGGTAFTGGIPTIPAGFTEEVLGESTDEGEESGEENGENGEDGGDILGETCNQPRQWLPLIMLLAQALLSLAIYYLNRDPDSKIKQFIIIGIIAILTAAFYFLRNCDCAVFSWLNLLCQWYVIFAGVVAALVQFANYALIEKEQ